LSSQQKAGLIIGLGVALPGLVVAGVFGEGPPVPGLAWLAISTVAGALGVVVLTGKRQVVSALLGALFGCGSLFAIPFYLDLRSRLGPTFFTFELVLPFGLVGLPLFAAWQALEDRAQTGERER
jgi:hypothetical protein